MTAAATKKTRGRREYARLRAALAAAEHETEPLAKAYAITRALTLLKRYGGENRRLEGVLSVQLGQALGDAPMTPGAQARRRKRRAVEAIETGLKRLSGPRLAAERAHAQIVLANVVFEHAAAPSEIERARQLYEKALSRLTPVNHPEDWGIGQFNLGHLYVQRTTGPRDANLTRAIGAYGRALQVYTLKRSRNDWVLTQLAKAVALSEFIGVARRKNQEAAIRVVNATLQACPRRSMPQEWGRCQNLLGALYYERGAGDRVRNVERAIAALRRGLEVRTRQADPDGWRTSTINLALAYSDRVKGRRAANLDRALALLDAAAAASPRGSFNWAKIQTQRAAILFDQVRGRRSANLARALQAGRAAMAVFDPDAAPREWSNAVMVTANALSERAHLAGAGASEEAIALLESLRGRLSGRAFASERATAALNLGTAYTTRAAGSHAENQERAISYCEEALKVFARDSAPIDWASLQINLCGCYYRRARGDRRANLERALECGAAALSVLKSSAHPVAWAGVKLNLANVYRDRLVGARASNLALAYEATADALSVLNPRLAPLDWAAAHQVRASVLLHMPAADRRQALALAMKSIEIAAAVYASHGLVHEWARARATAAALWLNRPDGERADNIEHAIVASIEALSVLSPENDPFHWGQAQGDLATGYFERSLGDRGDNIERGIAAFRAALEVQTRDAMPIEWARAQGNLAAFFIVRERGSVQENALRAARALRLSLQVFTKARNPFEWAQGTMNLALAVQRLDAPEGGWDRSISLLEEALTVLNARDHPLDWAMAQTNLANALRWRAESAGKAWVRRAIVAYRKALRVFTADQFPNESIRNNRLLATAYASLEQWSAADLCFAEARRTASNLINEGLNAAERARVLAEIAQLGPESAFVRWRMGDALGSFARLEAGRAVELTLMARLDLALGRRGRARLRVVQRAEAALAALDGQTRKHKLERLRSARAKLSSHAKFGSGRFALRRALDALTRDGAVIVAPVLAQSGAMALRAFRRGGRLIVDGTPIEALAAPAAEPRAIMGASIVLLPKGAADDGGSRAWKLYGEPLPAPSPSRRLVVLAPGQAPPPALAMGPDGPLIEHYETALWPNLFAIAHRRPYTRRGVSLGAVVDPRGDLDGALVEHGFCAPLFKPELRGVLVGEAARLETVIATLKNKSHWLIATHGKFDADEPRRSGLRLAQGDDLTLAGLAQVSFRTPPRLVILSACESGVTERRHRPEEFQGFVTTLLRLGAEAVVAANWPVDDMASAFIIGRFLELHLREALAPAAALNQAQVWAKGASSEELVGYLRARRGGMSRLERGAAARIALRLQTHGAHRPFADPLHWAAYSLWGA